MSIGTTGTNNVPLTPRRLARDQSNSPTPTNAVTTATPPITSSFNVSSSKSLSTVASFAKGVAPTNTELPSDTTVYINTYFSSIYQNDPFCLTASYIGVEEIKKELTLKHSYLII